ncbi:MAG: ABC transporter permease [Alicyclobacillaceae bacterium]|nr:ABC transporter permease [Alicyclobacillaceae bacterium]
MPAHLTSSATPSPAAVSRRRTVKSPTRLALERFLRNRAAVGSLVVLCLIVLASLCAPLLTHWDPSYQDLMNTDSPPVWPAHPLGTDANGIDYLARDLYGGRVDFLIGFVDMAVIMLISIVLGGLAGFYGGWVDAVIMRIVDFMMNFPFLLLIIVLQSLVPANTVWLLILVIAATGWANITRFMRGLFLNLREAEYVLAARIVGAGAWRIILRHMLPNVLGPLMVQATLLVANLIFTEAALAILGFDVPVTVPTWGNVLKGAQDFFVLQSEPWAWLPPAGLIFLTILCMNFISDGLRDAFDPCFD